MSACRDRNGFSFFTAKLSRMVGTVKRKRKVLAAQHAFLLDLFTAPRSSPPFTTPFFPFFSSHNSSSTLSKTPHFTSRTCSRSPLQPAAYSTPHTANSSPVHIHNTPRSAPVSTQHTPHRDPYPEKKYLHTQPSTPLHTNPSSLSALAVSCRCRGEHSVYGTLWAVILLALLCTFLCMGKEIAFVVATLAHLILQIVLGLGLFHPVEKDNIVGSNIGQTRRPLNRSATIPRSRGLTLLTSIQWNRRSKSWTSLNVLEEGKMQASKAAGKVVGSTASEHATVSWLGGGNLCAWLKLQVMLLFTLCGLFYGRFVAIGIAVCCILICSKMERLFFKRRLRV